MGWTKTRHRRVESAGKPWSPEEAEMLADAVVRAPSVHNTQPWSLTMRNRHASVWERHDRELLRHDPEGRDRRISCGAALANLVLAVRNAGWSTDVQWAQADDPAGLVATVVAAAHSKPSATEGQRYRAIMRRSSYRSMFDSEPVSHAILETLWAAASSSVVYARWVTGEDDARTLAHQLAYGARVFHGDRQYQRELAAWTVTEAEEPEGIPAGAMGTQGLAAVGLASSATRLPDEETLAAQIAEESVLVLSTASDAPAVHYEIGVAMELAWLAATSLGLAASVITQPLHLSEVRTELSRSLRLPGVPELVMRFGYPAAQVPRSSRHPSWELGVDDENER